MSCQIAVSCCLINWNKPCLKQPLTVFSVLTLDLISHCFAPPQGCNIIEIYVVKTFEPITVSMIYSVAVKNNGHSLHPTIYMCSWKCQQWIGFKTMVWFDIWIDMFEERPFRYCCLNSSIPYWTIRMGEMKFMNIWKERKNIFYM